jgi:hypothetical protein
MTSVTKVRSQVTRPLAQRLAAMIVLCVCVQGAEYAFQWADGDSPVSVLDGVVSLRSSQVEVGARETPGGAETFALGARSAEKAPKIYFSREFQHPVDVFDYFPLQVGTRWTYRHVSKDPMGPDMVMITVKWIEEIEIVGHKVLPEGRLILRKTTIRDITSEHPDEARAEDVEWCRETPLRLNRTHYFVQGNYLYEVGENDLDLERLVLRGDRFRRSGDFRKEPLPHFFFPMDKVHVWAEQSRELEAMEQARLWRAGLGDAPNPAHYFWLVEGSEEVVVPYGRVADAVHLRYGTLGGPWEVWFKRGLGVVRETIRRNVEFLSQEVVLLNFAPPAGSQMRQTRE